MNAQNSWLEQCEVLVLAQPQIPSFEPIRKSLVSKMVLLSVVLESPAGFGTVWKGLFQTGLSSPRVFLWLQEVMGALKSNPRDSHSLARVL